MEAGLRAALGSALAFVASDARRWARDWLLSWDTDASGDVNALSNPVSTSHADTALLRVVFAPLVELGLVTPMGAEDLYIWDGVTIGMVIDHIAGVPGLAALPLKPDSRMPPLRSVGRFVREEATGESLCMTSPTDTPWRSIPTCALMHLSNISSTRRHHAYVLLDYDALCRRGKDLPGLEASAICGASSFGERKGGCVVCGRTPAPGGGCGCSLPFVVPKSPLDFSNFRLNSQINITEYVYTSWFFLRPPDESDHSKEPLWLLKTSSFDTRTTEDAGVDSLVDSLHVLALQDRMVGMNPYRAVMPRATKCTAAEGGQAATLNNVTGGAQVNNFSGETDSLNPELDVLGGLWAFGTTQDVFKSPHPEAATPTCDQSQVPLSGTEDVVSLRQSFSVVAEAQRVAPAQPDLSDEPPPSTEVRSHSHSSTELPESGNDSAEPAHSTCERPESVDVAASAFAGETKKPSKSDDDARRAWRLERQRKNRLAAARSNARRKLEREALLKSLSDAYAQREALERKEAELRSLNLQLKSRAAGLWLSGARQSAATKAL